MIERVKYALCNEEAAGIMEAVVLISVFMIIASFLMIFLSSVIGFGTTRSDVAASGTGFWRGEDITGMNNP